MKRWIVLLLLVTGCTKVSMITNEMMTAYLPVVEYNPLTPAVIGVQLEDHITNLDDYIVPDRMYHLPVRWNEVEQEQGHYVVTPYLVTAVPQLDGNPWILGTRTCPPWARLWVNHLGSPPKEEYWKDYANFINAMITALDPWGVEIWNEPDTQPKNAEENYYGAWIQDYGDAYEAGLYYGRFTAYIYPLIKDVHPEKKIVVGALMGANLDFLRGAVDGGLKGDFLSVHKYIKKVEEFNAVFNLIYDVQDIAPGLPIIVTETSLLGDGGEEHQQMQADYVNYLRDMQGWEGVPLILWYSMANYWWFNNALVVDSVKTPAYVEWAR